MSGSTWVKSRVGGALQLIVTVSLRLNVMLEGAFKIPENESQISNVVLPQHYRYLLEEFTGVL